MARNLQKAQISALELQTAPKIVDKHDNNSDFCSNAKIKDTTCSYCNKIFVKLYGLNRHLKICKEKINIIDKLIIENERLKNE